MAELPRYFAQPGLPSLQLPTKQDAGAFGQIAESLSELAKASRKQRDAQDVLDLQEAVDQRDARYKTDALEAKQDPNALGSLTAAEFSSKFSEQAAMGDKDILDSLKDKSEKVREQAPIHFSKLKRLAFQSQFGQYSAVWIDQQQGRTIDRRDELIQKISDADEPAKSFYESSLRGLFDAAQASGVFHAEQIANMKRYADNQIMALTARQAPLDFINKENRGDFKNRDAVGVQTALDIAGKALDLQSRRDAQEGKIQSDMTEREFEKQAETRQLDVTALYKAADRYGWKKEKVDGLLRMQLGLKVGNPFESVLIEDALAPIDRSSRFTSTNITEAENNLSRLAREGTLDSHSLEYRAAMRHLQSLRTGLDVRTDVQVREAGSDARKSIFDLYGKYFPGKHSPRIEAERRDNLLKVDKLGSIQEKRQFVKELEAEFERKKKETPALRVDPKELEKLLHR